MKIDVVMPKMGESINEGTIIKWHKQKGEQVKKDEIIFEISTDKVDTEIPSPADGVLSDVKVFEQETVEVGTVVAIIETNEAAEISKEPLKVEANKNFKDVPSTTQVGGRIIDIPMPKMGESIMEGTIIKWHKKVGDPVKKDEIIFEISTDKVDTEVPSPEDGIVTEILFEENTTVEVNTVVAKLSSTGGLIKLEEQQAVKNQPITAVVSPKKESANSATLESMHHQSNKFFSPLVLNIARKENISISELETIYGSGINGRITKNDVLAYLENRNQNRNAEAVKVANKDEKQKPAPSKFAPGERVKIIPMDNIRQRIMYHMVNSRDTSVHVTAVIEIDMSKIHNYIEKNRETFYQREGVKLTYMPFISWAVIKAIKEYPLINATIDSNNIIMKNYINLGIAVAVEPNGLIVPNIKNADEKSIRGLAKSIADLGSRSRTKKLVPDDIMDGTFSITNYGVFGSLFGTPIINQPEVAILGVGAVQKKPVVVENDGVESIAIKPMMYLSLSHDHRLVDGMLGGLFLKSIKEKIENFDTSII
ncbi:MAG: 2-oxoglutarate dehydrogenase, E2 component, dihydrolipoamide succinyltransferase [Melioribacteraceae bacterium]|nr:2-oxoglutarate dehydrogenase, E2 component, dihydrolipoamide succinyltransferase [Melioribacteraceae bacterium]